MKKSLPASSTFSVNNSKGFTLVELLIIISILAILAVITAATFSNFQGRARDSRRDNDLKAIAKALEANYTESSATPYSLSASIFTSGKAPVDPTTSRTYCFYSAGSGINPIRTDLPPAAGWTASACPVITVGTTTYPGTALTSTTSAPNLTWFKVCALMDDSATIKCESNSR